MYSLFQCCPSCILSCLAMQACSVQVGSLGSHADCLAQSNLIQSNPDGHKSLKGRLSTGTATIVVLGNLGSATLHERTVYSTHEASSSCNAHMPHNLVGLSPGANIESSAVLLYASVRRSGPLVATDNSSFLGSGISRASVYPTASL